MRIAVASLILGTLLRPELADKQALERGRAAALRIQEIASVAEEEVHIPEELIQRVADSLQARGELRRASILRNTCLYYSKVHCCNCMHTTKETAYKLAEDCK